MQSLLNRFSIKTKGLIIAAMSAGGLIISAGLGLSALDSITSRLEVTAEHSLPSIVRLSSVAGELEKAHLELTRLALWITLEVDETGTRAQQVRIKEAQEQAEQALAALLKSSAAQGSGMTEPQGPALLAEEPESSVHSTSDIESSFRKYVSQTEAAIAMMNINPAMGTMIISSAESTFSQLIGQVRDLARHRELEAHSDVAKAVDFAHASFWRNALTMMGFAIASIALTILVIGNIIAPIRRIEQVITKLSGSTSMTEMPDAERRDELGQVARTMKEFQTSLLHNRRLQEERDELMNSLEVKVAERTKELSEQQRQLEEALSKEHQLNSMQRQFVSMVCHEFRTPLAIIDGGAGRLMRRADRLTVGDIDQSTKKIKDAVKRMIRLIESTLAAARMDDGQMVIEPADCDIGHILEACCENQQELSPDHEIRLEGNDLPEVVRADANALQQVFTNLLSNAVKYSPDAPLIQVRGWCDTLHAFVAVEDQGLGMDQDDQEKLFQRFFRAKTSTGIAGTGIGLNLVKKLTQEHGGDIRMTSGLGEGTTFTVSLPIAGPEDVAVSAASDLPREQPAAVP